jgi:hypothetical protein
MKRKKIAIKPLGAVRVEVLSVESQEGYSSVAMFGYKMTCRQ